MALVKVLVPVHELVSERSVVEAPVVGHVVLHGRSPVRHKTPVAKVVEVAFVVVPEVPRKFVMTPFVACSAVAKSEVVVACDVVAFRAVKFWSVVEEKAVMLPKFPKVEEATDAEKEVEDA
jgi:hypothetical protein